MKILRLNTYFVKKKISWNKENESPDRFKMIYITIGDYCDDRNRTKYNIKSGKKKIYPKNIYRKRK